MKYLLVVGFACDVYRKEPRARIFFGNKLIDEFHIPHHKDTMYAATKIFYKNNHILQPFFNELANTKIKNFPPLRFYEIDIEQTQNQLELRIDINNDDSNYNNGFITNSTMLQLQVCYFLPLNKELFSRLVKIREKNFINKNYAWFFSNRNTIFNLSQNGMEWRGENTQTFNTTNVRKLFNFHSIGGNGHFYCKLVKKYKLFIAKFSKAHRYNLNRVFIDYLYDKYQHHANQRNSD